jgi:hypothetical protein
VDGDKRGMGGYFYSITVRIYYIWDVDHVELVNQAVAKATAAVVRAVVTD